MVTLKRHTRILLLNARLTTILILPYPSPRLPSPLPSRGAALRASLA